MKSLIFAATMIFLSLTTFAQSSVYVNGYTKSNGTYVQGYYRTAPNATVNDNYSTIGNINPYTGVVGTKPRDNYSLTNSSFPSVNYSIPTIHTINSYSNLNTSLYSTNSVISAPTYINTYTFPMPSIYNRY